MNTNLTFDSFIKQVSFAEKYKTFLNKSVFDYEIKAYKIEQLTPIQIKYIKVKLEEAHQLIQKQERSLLQKFQNTWQMSQLKLFVWVTVCYANLIRRNIQNFIQDDWNFLASAVSSKSIEDLKYQSLKLYKQNSSRKTWTKEQDNLLVWIIKNLEMENHWNNVSKLLYFKSQKKYFKSPRKCRQRWHNHLDKTIIRDEWTLQQDLILFQQVLDIGTKWAQIAKSLDRKRTEHMIKNRFKSTIKKMQKLYPYSTEKKLMFKIIENISIQLRLRDQLKNVQIKQQFLQNQVNSKNQEIQENQAQSLNYSKVSQQSQVKVKKQEKQLRESIVSNKSDLEHNLLYVTGSENVKIQEEDNSQMFKIGQSNLNNINFVKSEQCFHFSENALNFSLSSKQWLF